jgi:hypothetical protein
LYESGTVSGKAEKEMAIELYRRAALLEAEDLEGEAPEKTEAMTQLENAGLI